MTLFLTENIIKFFRAWFGCLRMYQHDSISFVLISRCRTLHSDGFSIFTYPDDFSFPATTFRTMVTFTDFKFHFHTLSLKNGQSDFQLVKKVGNSLMSEDFSTVSCQRFQLGARTLEYDAVLWEKLPKRLPKCSKSPKAVLNSKDNIQQC